MSEMPRATALLRLGWRDSDRPRTFHPKRIEASQAPISNKLTILFSGFGEVPKELRFDCR